MTHPNCLTSMDLASHYRISCLNLNLWHTNATYTSIQVKHSSLSYMLCPWIWVHTTVEGEDWGSALSSVMDAAEETSGAWMGNGAEMVNMFAVAFGLKNAWSSPFHFFLGFCQAWTFLSHSAQQAFELWWMSRFLELAVPTQISWLQSGHFSVLVSVYLMSESVLLHVHWY